MGQERPSAPGLRWRKRGNGDVPYWFAPERAVAAGFEPRLLRLHYDGWENDPRLADDMRLRCVRLHREAMLFLSGRGRAPDFDGTFAALIERYVTDPESSYRRLKPSSLNAYDFYVPRLREHIGELRIDLTDGRDVQRWFRTWAAVDDLRDPAAKLPRARTLLAVLKSAVSFGILCRLEGCEAFAKVLSELEFPRPKRRSFAPTAAQIEAARRAAHAAGAPSRALTYALQYDTTLRQWDVIGIWVPLSDPRPSAIIDGPKKWIGPTWAMVDDALILRLTYSKTEDTSALRGVYDLSVCPMVMEELQHVALPRRGPLIVNEHTGLPYGYRAFRRGWNADFDAAGLPAKMWNRDLRAGALTEASRFGASRDDRLKIAGHTEDSKMAEVYDRDFVESFRRVSQARSEGRTKGGA